MRHMRKMRENEKNEGNEEKSAPWPPAGDCRKRRG